MNTNDENIEVVKREFVYKWRRNQNLCIYRCSHITNFQLLHTNVVFMDKLP